MGNGVVAQAPSTFADGATPSFRLNKRGELVIADWLFQLASESRLFMSGDELEATFNDGQAAITDTTPSYILRGPAGTIVQPLYCELELTTEGGAAPLADIIYIQGDNAVTAGTTIVAYNCKGGLNQRESKAIHQLNPTLTAFAANNVIVSGFRNMPDNMLSVGLADTVTTAVELTRSAKLLWTPPVPILLTDNAMIAVYLGTGSTDSKWRYNFYWAELDADRV